MKSENDPITEDEWLLRRVHKADFLTPNTVAPKGFRPRTTGRDIDTDGISLYRETCVADPVDILAGVPAEKRHAQGIVRVSVAFVRSLGLTIKSAPEPPIAGHVVIVELNASSFISEKIRILPIMVKLASEASNDGNIVKRPE